MKLVDLYPNSNRHVWVNPESISAIYQLEPHDPVQVCIFGEYVEIEGTSCEQVMYELGFCANGAYLGDE